MFIDFFFFPRERGKEIIGFWCLWAFDVMGLSLWCQGPIHTDHHCLILYNCVCACMCARVCACVCVRACACICTCVHVCVHTCMFIQVYHLCRLCIYLHCQHTDSVNTSKDPSIGIYNPPVATPRLSPIPNPWPTLLCLLCLKYCHFKNITGMKSLWE